MIHSAGGPWKLHRRPSFHEIYHGVSNGQTLARPRPRAGSPAQSERILQCPGQLERFPGQRRRDGPRSARPLRSLSCANISAGWPICPRNPDQNDGPASNPASGRRPHVPETRARKPGFLALQEALNRLPLRKFHEQRRFFHVFSNGVSNRRSPSTPCSKAQDAERPNGPSDGRPDMQPKA